MMTRHRPLRLARRAYTPLVRRAYTLTVSRAYTLAEMLIVMTIMLMLVVVALPAVKRVMEDGNVREASRQLNAYFAMAKSRALQTGRPCGVMMVCEPVLGIADPTAGSGIIPHWPSRQVNKFYLAEVPAPYSGGTIGAKGRIMVHSSIVSTPATYCFYPLDSSGALDFSELAMLRSLVSTGETILVRFDFKGAWYVLQYVFPSSSSTTAEFVFQAPNAVPPINTAMTSTGPIGPNAPYPPGLSLTSSYGYNYQIIRLRGESELRSSLQGEPPSISPTPASVPPISPPTV
jgi:type II secretory pathway pseudopilin PulG